MTNSIVSYFVSRIHIRKRRTFPVKMEKIYELGKILSGLEDSKEDYYVDFLNTKSFEAGIIRLRRDQEDTQSTHSVDEIYYVIEGEGLIRIGRANYEVRKGIIVFVPANTEHRFHGNKGDLIVLYVFAKE